MLTHRQGDPGNSGATDHPTVLEVKHTLTGDRRVYRCRACLLEPPRRAVLFYVSTNGWQHAQPRIRIPPGALTFGYYWRDRAFNVYHWLNPDGSTLGFYFNVAGRTSIQAWGVEWDDLELDYWVDAEGNAAFLDAEAVPSTLARPLARRVARARADLTTRAPSLIAEIEPQIRAYVAHLRA